MAQFCMLQFCLLEIETKSKLVRTVFDDAIKKSNSIKDFSVEQVLIFISEIKSSLTKLHLLRNYGR